MSDFIKIKGNNDIPNYLDYQDLCALAEKINKACNVKYEYIGMHLSERILYLTYYIRYSFLRANCYKIDIQREKDESEKPTGDYIVGFKRQSNAPIVQDEFNSIKSFCLLNMFDIGFIQGGNCIPLGSFNETTLCSNMQKFFAQLKK